MAENKTFTQEEVSEIVRDRLAKEKAKYEKLIEEKEAEYGRRDRLRRVQDEFKAGGIPGELVSLVPLGDDESCNNALALLKKNYVSVHSPVSGVSPENRGRTTPRKPGIQRTRSGRLWGSRKGFKPWLLT